MWAWNSIPFIGWFSHFLGNVSVDRNWWSWRLDQSCSWKTPTTSRPHPYIYIYISISNIHNLHRCIWFMYIQPTCLSLHVSYIQQMVFVKSPRFLQVARRLSCSMLYWDVRTGELTNGAWGGWHWRKCRRRVPRRHSFHIYASTSYMPSNIFYFLYFSFH